MLRCLRCALALVPVAAGCDLASSSGLRITGLTQNPEYNGEYLRDRDVNSHPTFWQSLTGSSCSDAMRKGECGALHWKELPAGNASGSACLQACEAEREHGCCRLGAAGDFRYAAPAPAGCALGHGKVVLEAVPVLAQVAACHGRAVVLRQVKGVWSLAPPQAWDQLEASEDYTPLAEGAPNGSLTSGFGREWGNGLWPHRFVDANVKIQVICPEPVHEQGTRSWLVGILVAVVVICMLAALVTCCCLPFKKARPNEPPPDFQENPDSGWDLVVGRSEADARGVSALGVPQHSL